MLITTFVFKLTNYCYFLLFHIRIRVECTYFRKFYNFLPIDYIFDSVVAVVPLKAFAGRIFYFGSL